ncbi:hypothetical protein FOZ63_014107 [Perkinsus olseni]|uniref:Uncharacterized protein n=1 Tax=Perkinsus olseni TaxID=32597 RepID=A0A7J6SJN5_PEROL|nr:hypothetical protein FOZ63_014107 [Perkinsus olseni]KAF4732905.1 hypothetical protein FOZ62_001236 [Perkinsus olseni]
MAITSTRIPSVLPCLLTVIAMVLPSCLGRIGDDVYCHYETEPKHRIGCMIGDPDGRDNVVLSEFYKLGKRSSYSSTTQSELPTEEASKWLSLKNEGAALRIVIDGKAAQLERPHRLGPTALMGIDYEFVSRSPSCYALATYTTESLLYDLTTDDIVLVGNVSTHDDGFAVSADAEFLLMSVSSNPHNSSSVFILGKTPTTGNATYFAMIGDRPQTP